MPEHIHLLTNPRTATPDLGRYLALIKQPFSKQIKELLIAKESELIRELTVPERPGKTCFRFWREGAGYDRNVFSPTAITHTIDYIHHNPVRRGLCEKAAEWKWSSASDYLDEPPRQQRPELPFIHGLPSGAV
jgi:putative transposase